MASRRKYTTATEIEEFADIELKDNTEADDQISQAEEIIDAYVGPQDKHVKEEYIGQATSGTTTTIIDTSDDTPLDYANGFFDYCEVEIVGGTNKGEIRQVSAYDKDTNTITVGTAFTAAVDSTTIYLIRQLSKFPRVKDVHVLSEQYYKTIPEAVKRATAAQLQYIVEKGTEFFAGATDKEGEGIGDYSYSNKKGLNLLIAPKARELLRGYINRTGTLLRS